MKTLAALAVLIGIAAGGFAARAADLTYNTGAAPNSAVNRILCSTQNIDLDLNANRIDSASIQVVYSSAVAASFALTDGTVSTGNIKVTTLTGLTTDYATNKVTITSNTAIGGATLYVNGWPLVEGKQWHYDVGFASNSALYLQRALNTAFGTLFYSTVTAGTNIVFSTAVASGSAGNTFTFASSTAAALTAGSATFTGGQDNASITISGLTLRANRDWFPGASTNTAATAITGAINASGLATVLKSSSAYNVVYATSIVVGKFANLSMSVSNSALVLSQSVMTGGTDSDIMIDTVPPTSLGYFNYPQVFGVAAPVRNSILKAPTNLGIAHAMLFTKTAGTAPGSLVDKTTYYASNLSTSSFKLADTSTGAAAGLFLTITTTTASGGGTFTLAPIALTGSALFKLQKSNDGVNFSDVYVSTQPGITPTLASVTFVSPYTSSHVIWDLGNVFYRYLRLAFGSGTWGGVNLNEVVNAKKQ